jgi:transglutaminase superfamily protein/coenzyme PQQ synthesis protein D (PqqD)
MATNVTTSAAGGNPSLIASLQPDVLPAPTTDQRSEGGLLLWVEGGLMYSINSTALLIWEKLEENRNGLPLSQLVDCLEEKYSRSPSDADFRLELAHDIGEMLSRLHQQGLIRKKGLHNSTAIYRITDGVLRVGGRVSPQNSSREHSSTSAAMPNGEVLREIKLILTPALADRTLEITPLEQIAEINRYKSRIHTSIAFLFFAGYDIALLLCGFGRICRLIERWPVRKNGKLNSSSLKGVCAGIERARIWYPKQINCMQHSAIVCYLLRLHGLPVDMAVAGRRMPFKSHAWAEVAGNVINDNQKVRSAYTVFKRY